jgi:chromosome segregation ATPase
MVNKENTLVNELRRKVTELSHQQDKWKGKTDEYKDRIDKLKSEAEGVRQVADAREVELTALRPIVDENQREKLIREVEKHRSTVLKRETEMKEVVRTLKQFAEDNKNLKKEIERLREQDDMIGHKNPN